MLRNIALLLLVATPVTVSGNELHQWRVLKAAEQTLGSESGEEFSIINGIATPDGAIVFQIGKKTGRLFAFFRDADVVCLAEPSVETNAIRKLVPIDEINKLRIVSSLKPGATIGFSEAIKKVGLVRGTSCDAIFNDEKVGTYAIVLGDGIRPKVAILNFEGVSLGPVRLSEAGASHLSALMRVIAANRPALQLSGEIIAGDDGVLLSRDGKGNYSILAVTGGKLSSPRQLVDWKVAHANIDTKWGASKQAILPQAMRKINGDGEYRALLEWLVTSGRFRGPDYDFSRR